MSNYKSYIDHGSMPSTHVSLTVFCIIILYPRMKAREMCHSIRLLSEEDDVFIHCSFQLLSILHVVVLTDHIAQHLRINFLRLS